MHLSLNNFKSSKFIKLSKSEILDVVIEVLKTVEYKFTKNHQLNLSFVSSEEMQLLNKTYQMLLNLRRSKGYCLPLFSRGRRCKT